MKTVWDERNLDSLTEEFGVSAESYNCAELSTSRESLSPDELSLYSEQYSLNDKSTPSRPLTKDTGGKSSLALTKYLSMIAAALTGTALIITVVILAPLLFKAVNEYAGCNKYSCTIEIENATDTEFILSLENESGEQLRLTELTSEDFPYEVLYEELTPEALYTIRVLGLKGDIYWSHTFSTAPFVAFGDEENRKIPFFIHEDLNASPETTALFLYDNEQNDCSLALVFGEGEEYGIQTERLFKDTYTLVMITDTARFEKSISLGEFEKPLINVENEYIGYRKYSCTLSSEDLNTGELIAVLEDEFGEQISSELINTASLPYEISFDMLTHEMSYKLTLWDGNGREYLSRSFKTDAFVSFGAEEGGKIPFYLHEDFDFMLDVGCSLYDSEGKDFSSNLIMDYSAECYIITTGLYRDTYSFVIETYEAEAPTAVTAYIDLGELEKPQYSLTVTDTLITLEFVGGALGEYTNFEVELSNDSDYYSFRDTQITVEGNNITVSLGDTPPTGEFTLYIWGLYENGDIYLVNQIYKTQITLP